MNVPSALVSRMVSLLPLAVTPVTFVPLPWFTSCAPTILVPFPSMMNEAPGEASSGFATRLIAYLKLDAVTGVPSLNLKPFLMKNVYVLPWFETVNLDATSGSSLNPIGAFRSG